MLNTTSEIKSLYNDLKGAIKSPEALLSIVLAGIIIKYLLPNKISEAKGILSQKLLVTIQTIIDVTFLFNAVFCSMLLIIWFFYSIIYTIYYFLSDKYKHNEYLIEKFHFYHRAYLGTGLRFLFLSRWLIILFCLLVLFDDSRINDYITYVKNELYSDNVIALIVVLIILLTLLKSVWHLLASIFYKYLYLQPRGKKDSNGNIEDEISA